MKSRNFVNLNINPCKMCMPMGAVTAFKGIENSMVILHGSQGCSTYIRRHMAGHYNEPIDIASSSLNEEGTVYGGENNLKKGLRNVIKLYNPSVIGVATTCLAETIGEDIRRITDEFMLEENAASCNIIPVSTPGYGGTQYEGFYAALTSIVTAMARDSTPNGKVNIIAPNLNPGDIRNIKAILEAFGLDYVLLPDISDTLDAPYMREFQRTPWGGTKIEDIKKMAGALATIEIGMAIPGNLSPGFRLQQQYNIPLFRCPIPVGIENTDIFMGILSEITGKSTPDTLLDQRGRLIDAMIDSHKYNAEGRAVIYGEPDQVLAVSRLCFENGIKPVLICTGSQSGCLEQSIKTLYPEAALTVLEDTDFETIARYSKELNANLLIGNSDGRFITEKEGIPLVRIGFPIHDRVGGQRQVTTGYNGSVELLDRMTNTLLESKYESYRVDMYQRYYTDAKDSSIPVNEQGNDMIPTFDTKTANHPCFSGACSNARMHIPVAPSCNISCNYCNRKYDCLNESRPGVTSEVLTPEEAAAKFLAVKEKLENLKVVGIAGPGDALADFEKTKRSIELIKQLSPETTFCLSTNGLMLPYYADEIVKMGVSHITVTINAVDPKIAAKIYREVNFMGMKLKGETAANVLIHNQLAGLSHLSSRGIVCKVNIVMIKGINDCHIEQVVKKVKECGAFMTNIMPLIPAKGSRFENMPLTNNKELNAVRKKCEVDLKQMYHCRQCRADAIGTLGQDRSAEFRNNTCGSCSTTGLQSGQAEYTFAIASKSGIMIDQHFGHAEEFYIYKVRGMNVRFVEKRRVHKYCQGKECDNEASKIESIIKTIAGCDAVLVLRIGSNPGKELERKGIRVIETCEAIGAAVKQAVSELEKGAELPKAIGE